MTIQYKGFEYHLHFRARRSWLDFHVSRPSRHCSLKGFVWGRLSFLGAPVCEACGNAWDSEGCKECCEHEFDWSEGYTCLNCGAEGDVGELIDAAEYSMEDR